MVIAQATILYDEFENNTKIIVASPRGQLSLSSFINHPSLAVQDSAHYFTDSHFMIKF